MTNVKSFSYFAKLINILLCCGINRHTELRKKYTLFVLLIQAEALQAECDFAKQQLVAMKGKASYVQGPRSWVATAPSPTPIIFPPFFFLASEYL